MNIGYIIDLNDLIKKEALEIPYLRDLYLQHLASKDVTPMRVRQFRDEVVLRPEYASQEIEKHIFFFVVKNDVNFLKPLSECLVAMQQDALNFNQARDEFHIILNLIDEEGLTLSQFEDQMPCLKNNAVCVYSWLVDKYDYRGGMPITEERRAHAMARLAGIITQHRSELSLQQMHSDRSPIYNLFGDASLFFSEKEREHSVREFFYYKSIQHLLNLSDDSLNHYFIENVDPYKNDLRELRKRVDVSAPAFLNEQRKRIEATVITEKTQGLLIKSSDLDKEYLINATDNRLVFIDDLKHKQQWQLKEADSFLQHCREEVELDRGLQETITDEFIQELQDKRIIHKRTVFDSVNNEVSRNKRQHVDAFKKSISDCLMGFLNIKDDNYHYLSEKLTRENTQLHRSNIDKGIAFLEYLNVGKGEYLVDEELSAGDTCLEQIKNACKDEEQRILKKFSEREEAVLKEYASKSDEDGEKPSEIKSKFIAFDKLIAKYKEDIRLLNYQLEKWHNADEGGLTARSKAVVAIGSAILISALWLFVCIKWLNPFLSSFFESIEKAHQFEWGIFSFLIVLGLIIGGLTIWSIIKQRKRAEESLRRAKEKKKKLMSDCLEEIKELVDLQYYHMLAFHGHKTIVELMEYVRKKEDDLIAFRKTLFQLLINYRLSMSEKRVPAVSDFNTLEVDDVSVEELLFGNGSSDTKIPFCFAEGGIGLSDAFDNFKKKQVRLETTRFSPGFKPADFNADKVEAEVIPAREEDMSSEIQYTTLERSSILQDVSGVEMDDVHQGSCGDCYFMATLASIARMNPEYIVGDRGMIQELGDEHKFFRVRFYDKEGNRINVDIDNKFWNKAGRPIYAREGKSSEENSYDPWVMAVEKAWAKANNSGYDGIEGARADGKERVREVEYSFAVTGKSAFYCMTTNVPDKAKLMEMMKKHVLEDKLPITLYSSDPGDPAFPNRDPHLVENHAYALRSVNDDGTFDIFNPWNNYSADEDVRGKHYSHVSIDFIKDNFDVVVFFGIKESDFANFERDLTNNFTEKEMASEVEKILDVCFDSLNLPFRSMEELMTPDLMETMFVNSSYLFNRARIKDDRGINRDAQNLIYLEPSRNCDRAKDMLLNFLQEKGQFNLLELRPRTDDKNSFTIIRISPHFVLTSFNE